MTLRIEVEQRAEKPAYVISAWITEEGLRRAKHDAETARIILLGLIEDYERREQKTLSK